MAACAGTRYPKGSQHGRTALCACVIAGSVHDIVDVRRDTQYAHLRASVFLSVGDGGWFLSKEAAPGPPINALDSRRPLVREPLRLFQDQTDRVLLHVGRSGSTLVAAALSGRRYVGLELEEKYVQLAWRRLAGVERSHRAAA